MNDPASETRHQQQLNKSALQDCSVKQEAAAELRGSGAGYEGGEGGRSSAAAELEESGVEGSTLIFLAGRASAAADLASGVVGVAGSAGRLAAGFFGVVLALASAAGFFLAAAAEEEEAAGFLGAGFFLTGVSSSSAGGSAVNTAPNHFKPLSDVRALSARQITH
jgi:hypothetical protein